MKKFILLTLLSFSIYSFAETHEVKDFYIEVSKQDAIYDGDYLEYDDRYFIETRVDDGWYEVEIGDKLDSKFYQIRGTEVYMLFRYSPYLYRFDEGVLKVENGFNAAEYIEKE